MKHIIRGVGSSNDPNKANDPLRKVQILPRATEVTCIIDDLQVVLPVDRHFNIITVRSIIFVPEEQFQMIEDGWLGKADNDCFWFAGFAEKNVEVLNSS